jgi:hypothetical protein
MARARISLSERLLKSLMKSSPCSYTFLLLGCQARAGNSV